MSYKYALQRYPAFFWFPRVIWPDPAMGDYRDCWAVFWLGFVFARDRPEAGDGAETQK